MIYRMESAPRQNDHEPACLPGFSIGSKAVLSICLGLPVLGAGRADPWREAVIKLA